MSPQNLCIEMAPFLPASRDNKEVAGSHTACDTFSGSCGKFVPWIAGRLLTKRGFRDQTKAGLADLMIAISTEQCSCDFGIYRLLGQQCDTKVGSARHLKSTVERHIVLPLRLTQPIEIIEAPIRRTHRSYLLRLIDLPAPGLLRTVLKAQQMIGRSSIRQPSKDKAEVRTRCGECQFRAHTSGCCGKHEGQL